MIGHGKDKRELRTGPKPSATKPKKLLQNKNPQLCIFASRLSSRNYSMIYLGIETNWNKNIAHSCHENLVEHPEGQRKLWRENDKVLGL